MTKFLTQGTMRMQAEKDATGALKVTAWINPIPDYTVKHQEKEYVVFMPKDPTGDPLAFKKECQFSLFPGLEEWVQYDGTKTEIGIDSKGATGMPTEITSLKTPASF
jgi:hypothetical protein